VVERIPHSNLLFLAANPVCELDSVSSFQSHTQTPTPVEIDYNDTLACYINTYNNFTRRIYTRCYNNSPNVSHSPAQTPPPLNRLNFQEHDLNQNRFHCGHTWKP
jgi:hypothetical protein